MLIRIKVNARNSASIPQINPHINDVPKYRSAIMVASERAACRVIRSSLISMTGYKTLINPIAFKAMVLMPAGAYLPSQSITAAKSKPNRRPLWLRTYKRVMIKTARPMKKEMKRAAFSRDAATRISPPQHMLPR